MQIGASAAGFAKTKFSEAAIFLKGGVRDVTVAYPLVDPRKADRLIRLAVEMGARLRLVADPVTGFKAIAAAARASGARVEVLIEVDVGLHRCGVDPQGGFAAQMATRLALIPSRRSPVCSAMPVRPMRQGMRPMSKRLPRPSGTS
ncbi:MAG: alanine racemase [Candidatus Saccharibacteria bacterium]|nr:alanine racemase [Pseudorhodobacter sp.]